MIILIEKDAATKVPQTVETLDDAKAYAERGFHISVQQEDGTFMPLADVLAEQVEVVDVAEVKPKAKKK